MVKTLVDINRVRNNNYYTQCKRCFMTGKACIYQSEISKALRDSATIKTGKMHLQSSAFMLMPFRSTLDEVYRAQLEPCLRSVVDHVSRADDVARTGYVICEKICKQIQLADVICAELSCDNPNVFYELGLAYAIDRNISLFVQKSVIERRSAIIKKLGLGNDFLNHYDPFEMLDAKTVKLWKVSDHVLPPSSRNDQVVIMLANTTPFSETINKQELSYTIDGLCRGAIHRTLDRFQAQDDSAWDLSSRHTIILKPEGYIENETQITFQDVVDRIRNASCIIICTHESEPCSYFWLGFSHGIEKDVIPITVEYNQISSFVNSDLSIENDIERSSTSLPFDIRALWHISFRHDQPTDLEKQLKNILDIVTSRNKEKQHRTCFWQPFIDEEKVSVYVGSVELTEKNKRHVVGEWDYRAVSELTSFFASIKETMITSIQTPTFQASTTLRGDDGKLDDNLRRSYVHELLQKLRAGNSIILATADVNDLTEVALATQADEEPFVSESWKHPAFNGIVAVKNHKEAAFSTPSVYFQSINPGSDESENMKGLRGFYDIAGGSIHSQRMYVSPYVPYSEITEKQYSVYFSHIAKFKLRSSNHWTVVLQGITGPATLGLVQALTGGVNIQFTVFSDAVSPQKRDELFNSVAKESKTLSSLIDIYTQSPDIVTAKLFEEHSESITKSLTSALKAEDPVEAIIKVYLMDGGDMRHDERLVIWWDFDMDPRTMFVRPRGRQQT